MQGWTGATLEQFVLVLGLGAVYTILDVGKDK